ncbi:MAG: hypothetical protein ACP5F9_10200 [Thiomonas sp.]|jgi:hypothetical protein
MTSTDHDFEHRLAQQLHAAPEDLPDLPGVLRRARRRVNARNVLSLILGRIWLALASLLAPAAVRLHRLSSTRRAG